MTGWHLHGEGDSAYVHRPAEPCHIAGCRPVVVLDPEDAETVEKTVKAYNGTGLVGTSNVVAMQRALRSLIQPPRPTEPTGLAALIRDGNGTYWIRIQTDYSSPWMRRGAKNFPLHKYADLADPVEVLGEGHAL